MCLGVPGKVVCWFEREGPFAEADIEFDGVRRRCYMACATDAEIGDYVIIHSGIAITRVEPDEAERVRKELAVLDDDDGWSDRST